MPTNRLQIPVDINYEVHQAFNSLARSAHVSESNSKNKRYRPEVYAQLKAKRLERERTTGNKELGPL